MQLSTVLLALAAAVSAVPTTTPHVIQFSIAGTKPNDPNQGTASYALRGKAIYDDKLKTYVYVARRPTKNRGSIVQSQGAEDGHSTIDVTLPDNKGQGGLVGPFDPHRDQAPSTVFINKGYKGDAYWTVGQYGDVSHAVTPRAPSNFLLCDDKVNGNDERVFKFGPLDGTVPKDCVSTSLKIVAK